MTALPVPYQRISNFTDWQANHPTEPVPGTALDAEFNAIRESITQTQARLTGIQEDDGSLSRTSVLSAIKQHLDDLAARVAALEARP